MNMRPILNAVAAAGLVAVAGAPGPAWADDAEIYVNQRDLPEASQPLVMFSLDYRPNLGSTVCQNGECQFLVDANVLPQQDSYTFFDMLRAALKLVMEPLSGVRVGLMLNHDDSTTGQCGAGPTGICSNGGYIAMGFKEFKVDDTSNDVTGAKAMFHSVLETMPVPGDSPSGASHLYQGRELFYEFYRYLTGAPVWNGMKGFTSFDHNTGDNNINIVPEYAARWAGKPSAPINGFGPDPTIIQGAEGFDPNTGAYSNVGTYISPLTTLGDCSKIFTVNFMFQVSQQEANSDNEIARYPGGIAKGSGPGGGFAPMIEYLNRTDLAPGVPGDQKVISYFLGTEPQVRNNTFAAYATAGGTGSALPITENPEELVALLNDVFKQILSVSTTFTAAALPVNSFDRAQLLSDVFLGLFQPQVDDFPQNNSYWWGNVKKLKLGGLGDANEAVQLVDANNNPAVAADGRIRYTAQTLWTDPSGADVLDAGRDPDPNAVAGYDGRSVNRGGAGHKTPGFRRYLDHNPQRQNAQPVPQGPRRLFFDDGIDSLAALEATDALAGDAALQAAIGAADSAEALEVLKFMRGLDPIAEDPNVTPSVIPLEWMFGSVIHSRPLPVNYGARDGHGPGNPLIYIAAGGNDGALRFIRNTDSSGPGRPGVLGVRADGGDGQHSQDRPPAGPGVHRRFHHLRFRRSADPLCRRHERRRHDRSHCGRQGDPVRRFAPRGPRLLRLDVSNPEAPALLWRIVGGVTQGFENLGWTFSQPRTGKVRIGTEIVPVVIFGGGFDRAYDNQLASVSGPTGRGIYIVNALTGSSPGTYPARRNARQHPVAGLGGGHQRRWPRGPDLRRRSRRTRLAGRPGCRESPAPGQRPCSPTWVAARQGVQLAGLTIGASSMPRTSSSPACWSLMAQAPWRRSSSMPS
jgi:type IV pilus assembly protein PilY1